ncbi:unnamed protein product [Rhizophagus irregularis]|nr:unnamed protein product [Rhizophagus irregularis]
MVPSPYGSQVQVGSSLSSQKAKAKNRLETPIQPKMKEKLEKSPQTFLISTFHESGLKRKLYEYTVVSW